MKTTALLSTRKYTAEEYLALEDKAEYKSEFWDGYIIPLHGASPGLAGPDINHIQIVANLVETLSPKLKKKECRTFSNDLKIRIPNTEKFLYPDVTVVRGKLEFYKLRRDVVTNPKLIVEVLSDNTAVFDRSEKLWLYQTIESLQEYVLIWPEKAVVEQYLRGNNGSWIHRATTGIESTVDFESVAFKVKLSDIYELVEFF